jgi:hypothetical protein
MSLVSLGHRLSIAGVLRPLGALLGLCGLLQAGQTTVTLDGFTEGAFRWKDVAGNPYGAAYQASYRYTQARVQIAYSTTGTVLRGTVTARHLKPNFAYQLKLSGLPESDPAANANLGFSGRWWREEWNGSQWSGGGNLNTKGDGSFPNPNDIWLLAHKGDPLDGSPTGLKYRFTGYRLLDYFITDASGNATVSFAMRNSYHVLYGSWQGAPDGNDGPMKWRRFDPDPGRTPAYDADYPAAVKGVFGEWERLPKGGIGLAPGPYTLEFLLTEESFHESGLGGTWAHAAHGPARFTIAEPAVAGLPPSRIAGKSFLARWIWREDVAPEGELCVSSNALFTQAVPGYEARYMVNRTGCRVTNLVANQAYWYRIRKRSADGNRGPWSNPVKVRTGTHMPVFRNLLSGGAVSKGITQQIPVSNQVAGAGTLTAESSDTNAVTVTISAGVMTMRYRWKNASTATVTLTLTEPETRFTASYGVALTRAGGRVTVLGASALTNAGTRVAQEVTLENRTGETLYGLRVRALGLDRPGWLINRTGLDPASQAPILELPGVLPAGSQTVVRLVYNSAYVKQSLTRPVTVGAWAIMTPVSAARPVATEMAVTRQDLHDGLWLIGWPAIRNRLYAVYHSDDDGATWTLNGPFVQATSNAMSWLDLDAHAPAERVYRVVEAGL